MKFTIVIRPDGDDLIVHYPLGFTLISLLEEKFPGLDVDTVRFGTRDHVTYDGWATDKTLKVELSIEQVKAYGLEELFKDTFRTVIKLVDGYDPIKVVDRYFSVKLLSTREELESKKALSFEPVFNFDLFIEDNRKDILSKEIILKEKEKEIRWWEPMTKFYEEHIKNNPTFRKIFDEEN